MKNCKIRLFTLVFCAVLLCLTLTDCADDSEVLSFSAEKVFSETHEVSRSYQGAASYGKYFFQFSDHMENVGVYDLKTERLLGVTTLEKNQYYHCNNANFGRKKWAEEDEFPLLYVSMEHLTSHCALVFRVQKTETDFVLTKVQTIVYPDPEVSGVYYPNCVIDGENNFIYVIGYTENSYEKKKTNRIRVTKYALPDAANATVQLKTEEALDSFEVESITATQGAVVVGGKIYQVYGFEKNSFFKILDPDQKAYTASVRLPKHSFRSEPECLVFYNDSFYCADVKGNVYRFSVDPEYLK